MEQAKAAAAVKPRLPPGFRFRPTDEELVVHYLRRRALACPMPPAVDIPDIRILAHDPSDLLPPGWSEPERYFFTCKEAKYVKGRRANRATGAGYWKATGKEKPVSVSVPGVGAGAGGQSVLVGMKRSLVFYRGKPPSGLKTEWVMHEYRLAGAGLAPCRPRAAAPPQQQQVAARAPAEGWVLCRVFRKKGSAAAVAAAEESSARGEEGEVEEEAEEEVVVADAEVEENADGATGSGGFIDFFARADAARRGQQQGEELEPAPRRASSPVVSSSCLTEASLELQQPQQQCCRDQETTSSSRGA